MPMIGHEPAGRRMFLAALAGGFVVSPRLQAAAPPNRTRGRRWRRRSSRTASCWMGPRCWRSTPRIEPRTPPSFR